MQTFSGLCYVERADDLSKEGTASLEAFHRATRRLDSTRYGLALRDSLRAEQRKAGKP